ncbi:MAG TPA: hypothetical protein VII50_01365, partial [Acidothermaceae bacterium]
SARAGSSSAASTSGFTSPTPLVSIGSPAPTDAAESSRVQAVTELAQRLLAEMVLAVPGGSKELGGQPVGVLTAPMTLYDDDVIDVADWWTVPETADAVLTYVQHHLPAGLTSEGTGGGPVGAEVVFDRTPAGPADEGATVYVAVAPDPAGGTDLRVDVQDRWQPVRPALEQVPSTVTGATLVRRAGLRETPLPPVTIHVGADIARHIAALLNALPSEAGGAPDAGGGADTTTTVSFDGDPGNVQYVVAGSFYNAVTVDAPSQAMPTLSGAGDLDSYLEGLF